MALALVSNGGTALGGVGGRVVIDGNIIVRVKTWSLNSVVSESAWGDSNSGGFTNRKPARADATGTIVGVMDDVTRIYSYFSGGDFVGRLVQLSLWEKLTSAGGAATRGWWFPCALIQGFDITLDMDTKEVVEFTMSWGSDGIYYRPGAAEAPDAGT